MPRHHSYPIAQVVFAIALLFALPHTARALGSVAMDFDLSPRSDAMGGAGDALFWGDLDHSVNPALLGYAQGVRYERARAQLIPEIADHIVLTSEYLQVGGGGIGFVASGKPFAGYGVMLDYGVFAGPVYGGYDRVRSWGVGASLLRTLETVLAPAGVEAGRWSRRGDVSIGLNVKDFLSQDGLVGSFRDSTTARDWGVHLRLTPIDQFHSRRRRVPLRLDVSAAASVLSYNDAQLGVGTGFGPYPVGRHHRYGEAVRLSAGRLARHGSISRVLAPGVTPLVSAAVALEQTQDGYGSGINMKTDAWGAELTLANVLSGRRGHYQYTGGQIDGPSWGWGVALPLGAMAGARYDESWWPQARDSGIRHRFRRGFTAWLDPIAIWNATRTRD